MNILKTGVILAFALFVTPQIFGDNSPAAVALEPSTKIIYPQASDIIPGKPSLSTSVSPAKSNSPAPVSASPTLSAPVVSPPSPVSLRSEGLSHDGKWYLSWGPWASRQEASDAFPGIYKNTAQQNIFVDNWLVQKIADGQWALIAGPVDENVAVNSLKFSQSPPNALFRP